MSSYRIDMEVHTSKTGDAYKQTATDLDNLSKKSKQTTADLDAHAKATDKVTSSKKNLSGSLTNAASKLDLFGSGLGGVASKTGGVTGAIGGLISSLGAGGLVGVLAAAGIAFAAFAAMSVQAAMSAQADWAVFQGIAESAGQSFDEAKAKVRAFAMEAGLSVAEVRTAQQKLIQTNNDSPGALRAVHEMAIGLGSNMETAATAYARIVAGSGQFKRTLVQLGIKPEDIMTGGKVDTAKLQAALEAKYGGAADKHAQTMEAAIQRLTTAGQGAMVKFGTTLLPFATGFVNALAYVVQGITAFGEGLFVGLQPLFDAFSAGMKTLSDAFNTSGGGSFDWIGAVRWWGQQLGMVLSYLIPVIAPMIGAIAYCAPQIVKLGQYIWIAGTYVVAFGQALYGAGLWIYNLPGRIWSAIMSGVNSFVSAFWSAANWIWNLPGNLWSLISSRIPTLRWPTAGEILGAIKGALGISGPGYNVRSMYNEAKAQQVASSLQRQAATNTPSASTSKFISAYNAYKSPFAFGPGNDFTPSYKRYAGHQTNNVWNEDGSCLTGNCVDMTYGMINRYGGGAAIGNWNGGLHMWYVSPNGEQLDPSRKALEGTWSPPAQGPSSTNAPIIIPVSIGGKKVAEFIVDTVTNEVFDAGRF